MAALVTPRGDDEVVLEKAGADIVVRALDDIDVGVRVQGRLAR